MDVTIELLPKQIEFIKSEAKILCLISGFGFGKSRILCTKMILKSMMNPGLLGLIVSPSIKFAKRTIVRTMHEILTDVFKLEEGKDFTYNRTELLFEFPKWKGILQCCSADRPETLKGSNAFSIAFDEASQISKEAYLQGIARVRDPRAVNPQILIVSTPDGLGWLYDLCEGDMKTPEVQVIHARTSDNIYLSPDYEKTLRENYDEQLVKSYLEGKFTNLLGGLCCHAFNDANIIKLESFGEADPELPLCISQDFNYSPQTATVFQEIYDWEEDGTIKRKVIIFDEFWLMNCDTQQKCERILDKYGDKFTYHLYMDNSASNRSAHGVGKSDLIIIMNCFKNYNHRIFKDSANPKRIDRNNNFNRLLCSSLGERFVLITDNCKHLIEDIRKCTMDEFLNNNFKDKNRGHILDSIQYGLNFKYPIKRSSNQNNLIKV